MVLATCLLMQRGTGGFLAQGVQPMNMKTRTKSDLFAASTKGNRGPLGRFFLFLSILLVTVQVHHLFAQRRSADSTVNARQRLSTYIKNYKEAPPTPIPDPILRAVPVVEDRYMLTYTAAEVPEEVVSGYRKSLRASVAEVVEKQAKHEEALFERYKKVVNRKGWSWWNWGRWRWQPGWCSGWCGGGYGWQGYYGWNSPWRYRPHTYRGWGLFLGARRQGRWNAYGQRPYNRPRRW